MRAVFTGAQGAKEVFHSSVRLLIAIFLSNLLLGGLSAQINPSVNSRGKDNERAVQVRNLNNCVLQLHGQVQGNGSTASAVRGQAASALAQRAAALHALIQEDPHAALSFAFSADLLADLAAKFPDAAAELESYVTASGPIEHSTIDSADLKTSRESWSINSSGTRLNLYFSKRDVPSLTSGPLVTIEGVRIGADVAVYKVTSTRAPGSVVSSAAGNFLAGTGGVPATLFLTILLITMALRPKLRRICSVTPALLKRLAVSSAAILMVFSTPIASLAQSTCSTTGVQNVAVLIVNFQDAQVAVTPQQVSDIFFDTGSGHSLNGYWQEASYGQTSATGSVFGPYTIGASTAYSCINMTQILNDAVASASASGANLQNYTRISIVFPGLPCGWAGMTSTGSAGAGCNTWNTPAGTLTASVSYLISSYLTTRDQGVILTAHENGHQLGLDHAGTVSDEPTAVLGPSSSPGTIGEFNDFFSVMGAWTLATYSAQHKSEILNWMANGSNYQLVQSSGTYTLQPLEANPPGLQGLKIQRGTGNTSEYLWVEYRQPMGSYDSTIGFMNFTGALVHYESSATGKHTNVLDFTAGDVGSWYNTVLAPGQSWTDPYSNVSLAVQSATSNGLTLSVSYGNSSSCVASAPTLNIAPLNPSIYPGQTAGYSVSVTNNDSSACAPNTVNLASSEPAGWSTNLSSSSITLGPGQSANVSLGKGAPSGTPAGTYAVNLTASNAVGTTTDIANATVVAAPALSVSVSISGSSFSRPGTVPVTASVVNGGLPAAGANVVFTLVAPNGSISTQSASTNSSGIASWNVKLNQRSLAGSYGLTAKASVSSGSRKNATISTASSNTVTFVVQ
jgi:M6 family metalloprotease-like protein